MNILKSNITSKVVASVLLASAAMMAVPKPAFAADSGWKPSHPVNLIIMAGTGGGADKLARLWQGIIAKHGFSPQPLIPINKPGGSGAEALNYMSRSKKGSEYDIMVTLNSLYTTPIRLPELQLDPTSLTAIRLMANDTFLLWVSPDKHPDVKTVQDFVKAVKADDGNWRMGGTGSGQEDSLVTAMLAKAYGGLKMKYIPYKGGGTVASQLIGGHIDSTVNNPAEQLGFYQADKALPLAAFTEQPLKLFPDAPTFKSLGEKKLVYQMDRMVVGPPDMPEEAQKFYQDLFEKVSETDEWKSYVKKNALTPTKLEGEKMHSYLVKRYKAHKELVPLLTNSQKQ